MTFSSISRSIPVVGLCFLIPACGTGNVREDIPEGFQSDVIILGTAEVIYTKEQILQNKLPAATASLKEDLLEIGVKELDITDGSEIGVLTYCYAHNSVAGCFRHMGFYVAHATPELRDKIKKDSLLSIKVYKVLGNRLVARVVHVYGDVNDPKLGCSGKTLNYKGLASFSPYGPPIAGWIDCPKIVEDEGWSRVCVQGAPPTGPSGERTCVFEMQKPPLTK